MRNQKRIDEKRLNKASWQYKDGIFEGRASIYREPFGSFLIYYKQYPKTGKASAEVVNCNYHSLDQKEAEYESLNEAVKAVSEYFEELDEAVKKMPYDLKERARSAVANVVEDAISKALKEVR